MDETLRMWIEVCFNIAYLTVVWALVIAMGKRTKLLTSSVQPLAQRFFWAFALLALGDTGHVGFRVLGYLQGDLAKTLKIFGVEMSLIGLGALATAFTVTFFYVLMLDAWQVRFKRSYGWIGYLLLAAAVVRIIIMLFPQNQWGQSEPPFRWSLYRNLPLMVQGLGVAVLILIDALKKHDRVFFWISMMIFLSYICYMPVIFFIQQYPLIGMLMIPKTLAYLGVAIIAYRGLFKLQQPPVNPTLTR